jgi:hypothetical protein
MMIQSSPTHPKNRISTKPYGEDRDPTPPMETELVWGIKAEPHPSFSYQHLHSLTILSSSTSLTYCDHNDVCEDHRSSISCHSCRRCSTESQPYVYSLLELMLLYKLDQPNAVGATLNSASNFLNNAPVVYAGAAGPASG